MMNRCALPFLSTDGHFEIHVIDIRSAFAKAMVGQVLDIPAPSRGRPEPTRFTGGRFLKKGQRRVGSALGVVKCHSKERTHVDGVAI